MCILWILLYIYISPRVQVNQWLNTSLYSSSHRKCDFWLNNYPSKPRSLRLVSTVSCLYKFTRQPRITENVFKNKEFVLILNTFHDVFIVIYRTWQNISNTGNKNFNYFSMYLIYVMKILIIVIQISLKSLL